MTESFNSVDNKEMMKSLVNVLLLSFGVVKFYLPQLIRRFVPDHVHPHSSHLATLTNLIRRRGA